MPTPVIIVMGAAGAGKTTIGRRLATVLGYAFEDADALHSPANIAKMAAGHPLTDADRAPWLAALRAWVVARLEAGEPGVLAASLLRRRYRSQVIAADTRITLVHLHAAPDLLRARMAERPGHFMAPAMLDSQLATLEPPGADENPIDIDVAAAPEATVAAVLMAWEQRQGQGAAPGSVSV